MTKEKISLNEAAEYLDYEKVGRLWWCGYYLSLLENTGDELGTEVYLSDGVYIKGRPLTNKELIEKYLIMSKKEAANDKR